jgi:DNA repair exonuclease SbcCD ATPase subunit
MEIEQGSRIRISPPRSITLVEQKEIEKEVKKKYQPHDVITLSSNNIGEQRIVVGKKTSDVENLRKIDVQERLIRDFLKDQNLSDNVLTKIMEMNRKYQISIDQDDTGARNVSWRIDKMAWSNLFNYGEGNILDFSRLGGLTGLFAPNGSGKSNFIDIILETCFDATTKGVNKNIYLINDNKEVATAIAEITANDQSYELTRHIEKIKYGQKSLDKVKEWGKTTIDFAMIDKDGGKEPLVGTSRPETEGNVRQRVGSFDDFMLTSLLAQWNPMDIIAAKETKRKEIIFRFLDLDIFGHKAIMAKDESKEHMRRLEELEDDELETTVKNFRLSTRLREDDIKERKETLLSLEKVVGDLDENIVGLSGQKLKIDRREIMDWASSIKKADMDIAFNAKKFDEIGGRLAIVETDLSKVLRLESKFDLKAHEDKEIQSQELERKRTKVESSIRDTHLELQTIQEAANELGEVTCPSCQTVIKTLDSSQKIQRLQSDADKAAGQLQVITTERDALVPALAQLKAYRQFVGEKESLMSRRDNLKLQAENLKLKIVNLESEKAKALDDKARFEQMELDNAKNDLLDEEIRKLQETRRTAVASVRDVQGKIQEIVRLLGSEQGILQKLEAQLAQLAEVRETCLAFEHYIRVMGKDGIPYQVLTQKLPLINEEINKILANVADFGIFLEHDPEEQSIRFFIQYGQYKSRLLELGSGAEKFLASIAIRNALLNISILPKTNMLIIDEGFGKLDPKNLESIQRMFDYLRTVFDHIIVISHLDTMKDMVDNMIEITTDEEGYAHIEVGGE